MRTKTRLTITLSEEILSSVDALVNGVTIRNRSHAIETLIKQSLSPSIQTAIILAGGEQNNQTNSALTKINNSYLLTHTIASLKKHRINRVIICLNQNETEIMRIFGNGENHGLKIEYQIEDTPLGTGGAVKKAEQLLHGLPFLVIHGDVLTNLNLSELCTFHFSEKSLATIAVKPRLGEKKYGQVFIQGNKIARFLTTSENAGISIINTGIYVFDTKIFDYFPQKNIFNLEKEVFPILAKHQQLSASIFQGPWFEVTNEQNLKEARARWSELEANI